jgi:hypothetical protein
VNRMGRQPHETALVFACLLGGVAGMLAFEQVASRTVQALPVGMAYAWYALMAIGGAITLAGLFFPFKGIKGLLVERSGLYILAGIWYGFGLYLMVTAGLPGLIFFLVIGAFATANVIRCRKGIPDDIKLAVAVAALAHQVDELGGEEK